MGQIGKYHLTHRLVALYISTLLPSDLTLPRAAMLKTILPRLIYTAHYILWPSCMHNHLQSSRVRWISSCDVITKGPYWTTGWSRGSPAIYRTTNVNLSLSKQVALTSTSSVPAVPVRYTPVWDMSPEKTAVLNAGTSVRFSAGPTFMEPFQTVGSSNVNQHSRYRVQFRDTHCREKQSTRQL